MFFCAQTSLTAEDFLKMHRSARDRFEFTPPRRWVFWDFGQGTLRDSPSSDEKYVLRRSFEELLRDHGAEISIPLLTNLVLWLRQRLGGDFSG